MPLDLSTVVHPTAPPSGVPFSAPNTSVGSFLPGIVSHDWRRVRYSMTRVIPEDDPKHRCLRCRLPIAVGQLIITRRSAHESTPGCWGPVEDVVHEACWAILLHSGTVLPSLGSPGIRWERYGAYPWAPIW